jgi:hypothetical protein
MVPQTHADAIPHILCAFSSSPYIIQTAHIFLHFPIEY